MKNFDNTILDYEVTLPNGSVIENESYLHIRRVDVYAKFHIAVGRRLDGQISTRFGLMKKTAGSSTVQHIKSCISLRELNSALENCDEYTVVNDINDNPFNAPYPVTRRVERRDYDIAELCSKYIESDDDDLRSHIMDYISRMI